MITQGIGRPATAVHITLRPPLDHQSNRLYDVRVDGRHLIAKEFLQPDELQDAPAREYQALTLLAALDIAPQPVFFEPALGPIVIYEYMPGVMWDRQIPTASQLAQLARAWLAMNAMAAHDLWMSRGGDRPLPVVEADLHTRLREYAGWARTEYRPAEAAADLCLEALERCRGALRELRDLAPRLCFCRADPRFANVIQRPDGRLGLVDWEDSGLRDPARDLADIVTHPNQEDLLSPHAWQAFLEPYLAARSQVDASLIRRMHLYAALFPVFWLCVIIGRGLQRAAAGDFTGWVINGLPAGARLQRYLARALAWPEMDFRAALENAARIQFFPT